MRSTSMSQNPKKVYSKHNQISTIKFECLHPPRRAKHMRLMFMSHCYLTIAENIYDIFGGRYGGAIHHNKTERIWGENSILYWFHVTQDSCFTTGRRTQIVSKSLAYETYVWHMGHPIVRWLLKFMGNRMQGWLQDLLILNNFNKFEFLTSEIDNQSRNVSFGARKLRALS